MAEQTIWRAVALHPMALAEDEFKSYIQQAIPDLWETFAHKTAYRNLTDPAVRFYWTRKVIQHYQPLGNGPIPQQWDRIRIPAILTENRFQELYHTNPFFRVSLPIPTAEVSLKPLSVFL